MMNNHMSVDLLERLLNDFKEGRVPIDAVCVVYPSSVVRCAIGVTRPADLNFHTGELISFIRASQLKTSEQIQQELIEEAAKLAEKVD